MIAVAALVYAVGAYGIFALPHTIIVYPFVFAVMPLLWQLAHKNGYVTAADGTYKLTVALTGMAAIIKTMGISGDLPIVAAFVILALYTYRSGLCAPARIAFVKDTMIYVVVLVAVVIMPAKLGGYGAVFSAANNAFAPGGGATGLILHDDHCPAWLHGLCGKNTGGDAE